MFCCMLFVGVSLCVVCCVLRVVCWLSFVVCCVMVVVVGWLTSFGCYLLIGELLSDVC